MPVQDTGPRSDAPAGRMPFFLSPYEILLGWMPREAARKGT